nr:restriction endonuclease subunit S [Nitrosomonas ureae]
MYGIKKLRELILELAVLGKLIPQELDWNNTTLGEIGSWAVGSGFPTSEQGSQTGNILFAKVSDMNNLGNEKFIFATNNTITERAAERLRVNVHPAGTVIFPKIGGAISTNKRRILVKPTAIDNNCLGLTPKVGVSTEWIFLLLSHIDLSKYQAGTSVPALAQGVLQNIPVMLPDETEQHRIVTKVDELMALCDQLETQHINAAEAHEKLVSHLLGTLTQSQSADDFSANWQRIAAHFDTFFTTEASIDALKQTLLQLAVMGKLVPQDPNDEPASELLKRIQAEKDKLIAEGKIKKDKPLLPISDEEKSFELPRGWEWVRLQSVIDVRDGTHDSPKEASGETTSYPLVTSKDFFEGGINFDTARRISEADHLEISKRSLVEKYDILFSMIGGNIGNQVMVRDDRPFSVKNVALFKYYDRNLTFPFFMKKYMENLAVSLQASAIGGAQPFITLGALRNLVMALPPLPEQHRIVTKVDELMSLCDQLKSAITQASQLQKKLADVVVEQAIAS